MAGLNRGPRGRVMLFPLPFQGHLSPMLQLADVLHGRGLAITILHTTFNAPNPASHPEFDFIAVADEMPDAVAAPKRRPGHDRCHERGHGGVGRAAAELGLPTIVLQTSSAAAVRLFRSNAMLHEKGYLPAQEHELNKPVTELPPVRVSDLFDPSKYPNQETARKILDMATEPTTGSSGIVINTFEALETPELEAIRDELAASGISVFAIGPLHKLSTIGGAGRPRPPARPEAASLFCGSFVVASSSAPRMQSCRKGSSEVRGRGKVVRWAPQQDVLAHRAVGGFWTHGGWNSTLESICEGVPMLCSPFFGDQLANGRYVEDVWEIGTLLVGKLERGEVERDVARLMEGGDGATTRERAKELKTKSVESLKNAGSTQLAVNQLVAHILSL
uniref:Cytokinin-N-glucosyltransferase 2 n=1 Tax=Aegilops tauschii TaxID=37682 RepID=M8ARX2_AEGTA